MSSTRTTTEASGTSNARTVALGAFAGTALEWYDYYVYGSAAALVFSRQFFPELDPLAGTLASFATFAVGFVARPVGAALFGHIGDRYGRRRMLLVTVVLIGVGTGCIGLLPTYGRIGVAAPILLALLRVLQGISVGGEWSGAATLAVEHAPPDKRGRYGVMPQLGSPVGSLSAARRRVRARRRRGARVDQLRGLRPVAERDVHHERPLLRCGPLVQHLGYGQRVRAARRDRTARGDGREPVVGRHPAPGPLARDRRRCRRRAPLKVVEL